MERGPSLFGGGRSLKHQSRIQRGGSGSREISLDSSPKSSESSSSSSYAIDHSLVAILNNPHVGKLGVFGGEAPWSSWFSSSSGSFAEFPPLPANKTVTEITRSDFRQYLSSISECYGRFEDIRHHASKELIEIEENSGEIKERGQGDSLVACLREVPSLYFKEDFALEDGGTFQAACPFSSIAETAALQENLSQYLDVVEVHLVKEISLRSDSFFEAQGKLQDLNGQILEACGRLRELKETIRLLESDLVDSARNVQELNRKRHNFLELQQKLRLIQYVSQALAAMKLLIAAADCAGALDVTDDLQHLLDSGELSGLHCFRHLQDQLAMAVESINSVLAAEFMRSVIRDVKGLDLALLSKLREKDADLIGHTKEVALDEEESSSLRDRLLPVIIGLLRTATLPAVLRVYRETIISEVKKAIKNTVANLLPELVARPTGTNSQPGDRSPENDGGGVSLADKLRSLSSYNFVLLLAAIFTVVQAHLLLAAEVKKVIEWVMGGLDGSYAADSVAAALALGAAAAAAAEAAQEKDHRYVSSSPNSIQWNTNKVNSLQAKVNEASSPSNQSKNFRADVLRENTEAIFAACDTAQFRWAKLLGVRAQLHPKLRLQDFLNIYTITQEFISATEKIGGRLGYQLRGTVQSQSKAFVDFQHLSRMEKITAVLDQETWVTIDVPGEFQVIVDLFVSAGASANGDLTSDTVVESNSPDMLAWDENTHSEISQHENENHSDDTAQNRTPNVSASRPSENQDTVPENSIPTHPNDHSIREPGRSTTMLIYRGVGYHMVNCGLILLKMLSEYIDISKCFPSLSSEVVHRVVEILKHFNTRTCQLVLGARAMQVSGLKSITAKHLALASQVVSFFYAIIPEIRQILMLQIPENRRTLLLSEIDRVAQDYKVHRNEIHAKLVQIMKERLLVHLRALPQIAESWNNAEDPDSQRQFARPLTKEVGILQRVLSRTLLATDVQAIFREVLQIFHSQLTEAFSNVEVNTPQASERLCREIQNILVCIHSLPSDTSNTGNLPNSGLLDEFLMERFGIQHNNSG